MRTLILATRNRHKAAEIRAVLGEGFRCLTLEDFPDAPPLPEEGRTFAANAHQKASTLAHWLWSRPTGSDLAGAWVLADDSGLMVDALEGAPGVHSARFAALDQPGATGNSPDADNNAKLLRLLQGVPRERRTARFCCAVALTPVRPAPGGHSEYIALGVCEGHLVEAPRGTHGFGYDPLFVPEGHEHTFAELPAEVKNRLSHRARALARARDWLERELPRTGPPEPSATAGPEGTAPAGRVG